MVLSLADWNTDTLEKRFGEIKRIVPCWALHIAPEKKKLQRGNSVNYLGYKRFTVDLSTKSISQKGSITNS